MMGKITKPVKINPWGDDSPEKLSQTAKTIGWGQQLKGLFNPDSFLKQSPNESLYQEQFKTEYSQKKKKGKEVLVFSREINKVTKEEQQIYQETTLILQKLKEQVTILEKKSGGLVADLSKVKVEQVPKKSGIYYIRFLEWLLVVVRQMRSKVEEGHAWLATFTKRKQKKLGYWKMYKKHGTTFGLSHERSLATQTG